MSDPSRSVWVDRGNDARGDLRSKYGITEAAFDIREPRLTPSYLDGVKAQGLSPRFYACWNWPEVEHLNGADFAEWVHRRMLAIGWRGNAAVDLNDETHSGGRIAGMLARWRQLRPTRSTLWTMEAHQSDLFLGIASAIQNANVDVGPQCYVSVDGKNTRVESASEVVAWSRIVPAARVKPFLLADQLGAWWEGCAFTQGALP